VPDPRVELDRGADRALTGWAEEDRVPAELALAYDFANTLDERAFGGYEPFDALTRPVDLGRWLAHRGLAARGTRVSTEDLALAHALRRHLRGAARTHVEPPATTRKDRGGFGAVAVLLPLVATLDATGGLSLQPAGGATPVATALTHILAGAVTAEGRGTWARLKMCLAPDCRWVFYDHCKPRTGRWCSTTGCGNRMKTKAYRARTHAQPVSHR